MVAVLKARPCAVVADPNQLVGESISRVLEVRFDVVANVSTLEELRTAAYRYAPDVIVMDLDMPGGRGLDVIREFKANGLFVALHP